MMTDGKPLPPEKGRSRASGARNPAVRQAKASQRSAGAGPIAQTGSKPPVATGNSAERASGSSASVLIDQRIRELHDWRGQTLSRVRALILAADPEITEEWKWMGTPVWSRGGNICTGETYKQVVKLTFARGASLPDPRGLFNSSLEGNTRRAIDLREGESLDESAFQALIQAAVAENLRGRASKSKSSKQAAPQVTSAAKSRPATKKTVPSKTRLPAKTSRVSGSPPQPEKVPLLSGGNPQIAKADGSAPVQAYIAAMPGWKQDLGRRLDALIVQAVPHVRQAVKWNSPFYGIEGQGWFLSFHTFTHYVKVTFFQGLSLRPVPPGGTAKSKDARWIDLREEEPFDEAQMISWVQQAAALPGWTP